MSMFLNVGKDVLASFVPIGLTGAVVVATWTIDSGARVGGNPDST